MQLLSFCFYLCVLCVQLPIWLGIGTIALPSCPSQDRDSRPPPGSSAHRDKHWFPLQLAFCLEAKWKCISRDLWSKQTKQPVLQIPVGIFPHGKRETRETRETALRARAGSQKGLKVKGGWGLLGWRLSQTQQQVLSSHRPYELSPLEQDVKGELPILAFFRALCPKLVTHRSWLPWWTAPVKFPVVLKSLRAPSALCDILSQCDSVGTLSPVHIGDSPVGHAWPL